MNSAPTNPPVPEGEVAAERFVYVNHHNQSAPLPYGIKDNVGEYSMWFAAPSIRSVAFESLTELADQSSPATSGGLVEVAGRLNLWQGFNGDNEPLAYVVIDDKEIGVEISHETEDILTISEAEDLLRRFAAQTPSGVSGDAEALDLLREYRTWIKDNLSLIMDNVCVRRRETSIGGVTFQTGEDPVVYYERLAWFQPFMDLTHRVDDFLAAQLLQGTDAAKDEGIIDSASASSRVQLGSGDGDRSGESDGQKFGCVDCGKQITGEKDREIHWIATGPRNYNLLNASGKVIGADESGFGKWPNATDFIVDGPDDGPEEWCAIPVEWAKSPADAIRAAYVAFLNWDLDGIAFIYDGTAWMRPVEEEDNDHTRWEPCKPDAEDAVEFHNLRLTDDPEDFAANNTPTPESVSGGGPDWNQLLGDFEGLVGIARMYAEQAGHKEFSDDLRRRWRELREIADPGRTAALEEIEKLQGMTPTPNQPTEGPEPVHIVFDGPPGPECGRFVEVEDESGRSISVGEWIKRDDGFWALVITAVRNGGQTQ